MCCGYFPPFQVREAIIGKQTAASRFETSGLISFIVVDYD